MVLLSTLAPITSRTGQRSTRRHTAAQLQFDSHHHLKVEWPMEHMVPNTLPTNASIQKTSATKSNHKHLRACLVSFYVERHQR